MYFGEKPILDRSKSELMQKLREQLNGILTPDLDNMIDKKPRVAVKFIKALSKISLTRYSEIEKRISNDNEGTLN